MPDMKKLLRDLADAYEQEEKGECLLCTHEPTTLADWEMFVQQMLKHFGVSVHYGKYMPDRFRDLAARNA